MTAVDIAPTSGKVYRKLPLTEKERRKLLASYKKAPLIQKKGEEEGKKKTLEAEKMLSNLFQSKNFPIKNAS